MEVRRCVGRDARVMFASYATRILIACNVKAIVVMIDILKYIENKSLLFYCYFL